MVVAYALLGLIVGAAINLLSDQLPRWRRVRRLPFCPACQAPRPARASLATLAYLTGAARCRACGAPIPARHPLVELGTAALFAFLWSRYGAAGETILLLLYTIYSTILILVLVIDLEHKLILTIVMYPAAVVAALGSLIHPTPYFWRLALIGGVLGFGILYLVYWMGELFVKVMSRARGKDINAVAFGYGDVRLGGFLGLILGFPDVLYALFYAILLGGLAGMIYWLIRAVILRNYSLFTAIPYGPFLVAGGLVILFFGPW
ncbi:MAG: prepilin peptidase [Anaerolineae bacterium]|nr:prepilin peptidase [Anaerolineae bacterium]